VYKHNSAHCTLSNDYDKIYIKESLKKKLFGLKHNCVVISVSDISSTGTPKTIYCTYFNYNEKWNNICALFVV